MSVWIPKVVAVRNLVGSPGLVTPMHRHKYVQTAFVLRGGFTIKLPPSGRLEVGAGQFYCIAQNQQHRITAGSDSGTETIDLRFQAAIEPGTDDEVVLPGSAGLAQMVDYSFRIPGPDAERLQSRLASMLQFRHSPPDVCNAAWTAILFDVASRIESLPREGNFPCEEKSLPHPAVLKAMDIIRRHYARPLEISALAEEVNVSVGHLSRLFRQYTGQTPKHYVLRHRIEQAKQFMLTRDTVQLKQIAVEVGFTDQQQFSRTFRKLVGCSPSKFLD